MRVPVSEEFVPTVSAGLSADQVQHIHAGTVHREVVESRSQAVVWTDHVWGLLQHQVSPVRMRPRASRGPGVSVAPSERGQEPAPALFGFHEIDGPQLDVMEGGTHDAEDRARQWPALNSAGEVTPSAGNTHQRFRGTASSRMVRNPRFRGTSETACSLMEGANVAHEPAVGQDRDHIGCVLLHGDVDVLGEPALDELDP